MSEKTPPKKHPTEPLSVLLALCQNGVDPENLPCSEKQRDHLFIHQENVGQLLVVARGENLFGGVLSPLKTFSSVLLAALLHDIGKVNIPEEILLAPRKLTSEEFTTYIHPHPIQSLEILGDDFIEKYPLAAQLIRYHHLYEIQPDRSLPDDPAFIEALFALIVCDKIMAAVEERPERDNFKSDDQVKAMLDNEIQLLIQATDHPLPELTDNDFELLYFQALKLRH